MDDFQSLPKIFFPNMDCKREEIICNFIVMYSAVSRSVLYEILAEYLYYQKLQKCLLSSTNLNIRPKH